MKSPKLLENLTTEFKREYVEDIRKTVIAFANTNGGTLYIGVNDDGTIAGLPNPDDTLLKTGNTIRDAIRPDVTLFVDYAAETIKGKTIIKVTVQKGTARPYYLKGKGIRPEGVYVRQGASSVPAAETAILNMIKETSGDRYEDMRSLNQHLTFDTAEKEFTRRKIPFELRQQKTLKLITADGIYTNLGLLLSDQCTHTVKLAVFEGMEKETFQDRREFSGSILKQLNEVFEFIEMNNHTHAEVQGLYRVDNRDYPEEALREALLNALVHRDYTFSGSILISIFDDRIEFVSIVGLVRGISLKDIMLGISIARNENLANIFYRLKLIEVYGTGMPKIMRSYADFPRKPKIEVTNNAFKITLPNRNTVAAAQPFTPDRGLSENESAVIALLEHQPEITRKDVEAALSVSQAMAVRVIRKLTVKGLIRAIGGGKNTRYKRLQEE
jgi:ATP-dependent DNA helicase RecG